MITGNACSGITATFFEALCRPCQGPQEHPARRSANYYMWCRSDWVVIMTSRAGDKRSQIYQPRLKPTKR
jgi:hypothetical protein